MAASGYTPISLYYSTTASAVPTAGNLANGELALNIADMKLYAKNSAGTVTLLASNASTTGVDSLSFGSTGLTPSTATTGAITVAGTLNVANGGTGKTSYTANGVLYASGTGTLANGSALTFDGTNLAIGNATANQKLDVWNGSISISNGSAGGTGEVYRFTIGTTSQMIMNLGGTTGFVYGTVGTTTYGQLGVRPNYTAAYPAYSFVSDGGTGIGNASGAGNTLTFHTNAAEVGRFNSAGNFGLGVTPSAWGSTFKSMQIGLAGAVYANTNVRTVGLTSNYYNSGAGDIYIATDFATRYYQYNGQHIWDKAASGTAGATITFTQAMTLSNAGGLSVGTTADPGAGAIYATGAITAYYSDERLKDVKGRIQNALAKVRRLSGVYYTNNDTAKALGYTSDEMQVGVLANQMKGELPEIVKPAPFDLDEKGNSKSGENYMTVQYERGLPLIIEAIKELADTVDALAAR